MMEAFPTEITRLIIRHIADKRTLAVIARCGSRYRALAESILYHSLRASKRHLPRHARHYTTFPHLAVYLRVLRVLDEERGTQSVESAAADSVGKILELAAHLEEVYFPSSTNGAHGHILEGARCFNLRILRCHFRDSEREICQFVARCLNLEDLELTASFGEREDRRPAGSEEGKLLLPLENHHNLRRLCIPAKHMMQIREGMWLRRYTDKSNTVFGYPQMVHLSRITGNMLQMLDVENLPEDPEFLYSLADMLPNLRYLATPWVFTVRSFLLCPLSSTDLFLSFFGPLILPFRTPCTSQSYATRTTARSSTSFQSSLTLKKSYSGVTTTTSDNQTYSMTL